jgi:hypothetical protein
VTSGDVTPDPARRSTCGYRVTWNGLTVAYLSDHQQPTTARSPRRRVRLELCRGADLLIHDAQYTPQEFAKRDWGHCMVDYAVWLAVTSGFGGWRCSTTTPTTTTT